MDKLNTSIGDTVDLDALKQAAIDAGRVILEIRAAGHTVETKYDSSPVTEADRAAEALIMERLAVIAPGIPVVAEESVYNGQIPDIGGDFFLVDPLDGTREFTRGGADFTVNIGLIRDGRPDIGVIYVPITGALFWASSTGGAFKAVMTDGVISPARSITVRKPPEGAIDVVASRSHRTPETDDFISRFDVRQLVPAGSSLKFCVIAGGEADLYPRMGTTMQWDTAAGDAILRAAGGRVVTLEGAPLAYGATGETEGLEQFRNPWFVATGGVNPLGD
jgi:3'(2'), 5'-bisphosphate nucleotidase